MKVTETGIELRSVDFDAASGTYRAAHGPETTTPSMAVIAHLVRVIDSAPVELSPLNNTVDTEALAALLTASDRIVDGVEAAFTYDDYDVTVRTEEVLATAGLGTVEGTDMEEASL